MAEQAKNPDPKDDKPKIRRDVKPDGAIVLVKENAGTKPSQTHHVRSGSQSLAVVPNDRKTGLSKSTPIPTKPTPVYVSPYDLSRTQVYISPQAWLDLHTVVQSCSIEISGLGLVDTTPDGLIITNIFLLEQDGGGSHTTLDPEAQARLAMELDGQGIDTGKLRFWWHSHPFSNSKPSPSGQDLEQFAAFGRGAPGMAPEWFLYAILNQKCDAYWRMDIFRPIRTAIEVAPTVFHPSFCSRDWEAEINTKVKRGGTGPMMGQMRSYIGNVGANILGQDDDAEFLSHFGF